MPSRFGVKYRAASSIGIAMGDEAGKILKIPEIRHFDYENPII